MKGAGYLVSTHKLSGGHYPNFILIYYKKLSKI